MITPHRLTVGTLLAASLLGGVTRASAIDLEGLVKNSPFGASVNNGVANAAPGTLEFRGMYVDAGVPYYSIYNLQTKQSTWVAEGEPASVNVPVVIKGFDPSTESLLVDNAGQPQRMELHQAIVVKYTGPQAAPMTTVTNGIATTAGGAPAGFTPGTPPTAEQIEAFRQAMRERFGKGNRGADGAAPADGATRQRGNTDAAASAKPAKTPKSR
jgi:hypothetical protein